MFDGVIFYFSDGSELFQPWSKLGGKPSQNKKKPLWYWPQNGGASQGSAPLWGGASSPSTPGTTGKPNSPTYVPPEESPWWKPEEIEIDGGGIPDKFEWSVKVTVHPSHS